MPEHFLILGDEILRITVGVRDAKEYRVRVGRVREWLRAQSAGERDEQL